MHNYRLPQSVIDVSYVTFYARIAAPPGGDSRIAASAGRYPVTSLHGFPLMEAVICYCVLVCVFSHLVIVLFINKCQILNRFEMAPASM